MELFDSDMRSKHLRDEGASVRNTRSQRINQKANLSKPLITVMFVTLLACTKSCQTGPSARPDNGNMAPLIIRI